MKKLVFLLILVTQMSFVSAQTIIDTVFVIEDIQFELWVRGFDQPPTVLVIDFSNGNQVTMQKGIDLDKPLIVPFSINQKGSVDFTWYAGNQELNSMNTGAISVFQNGVLVKELSVELHKNQTERFIVLPLQAQEAFRSP